MLPDFQGLQSHFNLDSVSKTYESLKESTEVFIIRPVREHIEAGVRFLRNVIDGEKQTEEEVHVNDDSEDYTPGETEIILTILSIIVRNFGNFYCFTGKFKRR